MIGTWILTQIRGLFALLTYCVYSLIEGVMVIIFDIANLNLAEGLVGDIHRRIYVFIAIFMIFKLTISFLQYMVNPEAINDKEKGAGKLIMRTIVMLVLVIWLPLPNIGLFPLLKEAQNVFIPVLPKVILGNNGYNTTTVETSGELMATSLLQAFYSPCTSCSDSVRPDEISSIDDIMDTYGDRGDGVFLYDFNVIFALVIGGVAIFIIASIAIKIGIRLFKMFLLEIIAPIPVMSYMDPKSAKNGAFAAWVKQLLTTFLDLFIRLGIIYVVIYLLDNLFNGTLIDLSGLPLARQTFVKVFLMIALLMFAKDAPNFVKDALGIKHDKDTSGGLAAITGGILGAGTGMISGAISGRGLTGAVTGMAAGFATGYQGGATGKKANVWSAAGDAALQGRTGDPKAKSGILAAMQASATKAQLNREGRKLNITDASIDAAKKNMLDMQGLAAQAERNWQLGIQTGSFKDLEGNDITMEQASDLVARTASSSAIATKNYEKISKAGDTYGYGRTFAQDLKKDKKDAKVDYKRGNITKEQYKAKGKADTEKGKFVSRT